MSTNLLLFLLISASAFSTLIADLNIDCGSSGIYADDYYNGWVGDDSYIQHGEPMEVQSTKSVAQAMTTLRVFTHMKKSCYSMDAADKGTQVLVRASFFYGNYDKKSSPPSFDLQFDGNHWTTVQTSSDEVVSYEVIYVTKMDTISVCVVQTSPNMFPFISAVEVKNLDSKMYDHVDSKYALMLRRRVAYGPKDIIRYSEDIYDRIWVPAVNGGEVTVLTSDELLIDVSLGDSPPRAVFQNAFATNSTSTPIKLGTDLPAVEVPIYMNMYFSEVSVLDSTQKRSFQLYIDGKSSLDPFVPVYAEAGELCLTNVTASSSTTLSLEATSDSTLPPLINALEVFTVSNELTDGTLSNDVQGLVSLQNEFSVLQDWGGDPCLPSPYSWEWINCTSASTPRVTALYLGSFGLSGFLPDFSSMTALEIIDLHNNSIMGSIPEFLGTLPHLKELNLANNEFTGSIPSSISNNKKLKLVVTGNSDLCVSGKSCQTVGGSPTFSSSGTGKKKKSKTPVILGTTIPIFILLWIVGGFFAVLRHKRKSAAITAGQAGGADSVNGTPSPQTGKPPMAVHNIAQNMVDDFRVNIQEDQSAQDQQQPVDQNDQQNRHEGGY